MPNFSPSYGNCFTFNSEANEEDPNTREASLTGVSNGLSIELYLDQQNYMLNRLEMDNLTKNFMKTSHSDSIC